MNKWRWQHRSHTWEVGRMSGEETPIKRTIHTSRVDKQGLVNLGQGLLAVYHRCPTLGWHSKWNYSAICQKSKKQIGTYFNWVYLFLFLYVYIARILFYSATPYYTRMIRRCGCMAYTTEILHSQGHSSAGDPWLTESIQERGQRLTRNSKLSSKCAREWLPVVVAAEEEEEGALESMWWWWQ